MSIRRAFAISCLIAILLPAGAALAQNAAGFYFGGYMGLKAPEMNFASAQVQPTFDNARPGKNFAGALGFRLASRWRVETELSYQRDGEDRTGFTDQQAPTSEKMRSFAGLVNFYYDFDAPGKIKPFVGMGAGYVSKLASSPNDAQGAGLVWQVGGGVNYQATPTLSFSGAYRYLNENSLGMNETAADYGGHEIHVGMSWALPYKPAPKPRPQ